MTPLCRYTLVWMLPALVPLGGCWAVAWNVDSACGDDPVVARGTIPIDGEARAVGTSSLFLDVGDGGTCVLRVRATLDLGRGCSLSLEAEEADRPGGALAVFDGSLSGEEGCGLDGGAEILSFGDSRVHTDAAIEPTDSASTYCVDGDLTVVLDLTVASGERSVPIVGEVVLTGVSAAGVDGRACR